MGDPPTVQLPTSRRTNERRPHSFRGRSGVAVGAAAAQQRSPTSPHEPPRASPLALMQSPATQGFVMGIVVGDPSMACKGPEVYPRSASNLPANLPRIASRRMCWLLWLCLSTCGVVMWRPAMPGSRCGGGEVFTRQRPQVRNLSRPPAKTLRSLRRSGRLPEDLPEDWGLRVPASGQRRSIRAAGSHWDWRWGGYSCSWSSSGMRAPFGVAVVVAEIANPSDNCRNRHRQATGARPRSLSRHVGRPRVGLHQASRRSP
jgi:hypothetical protein